MAEFDDDKSQEATPHRRQEAREQGQVARSHDLASAAILVVGLAMLLLLGGSLSQFFARLATQLLGGEALLSIDTATARSLWFGACSQTALALWPVWLALVVTGIGVNLAQSGILFLPEKLSPDLNHINPLRGWQRIFSLSGAMRLGFGLLKLLVVAAVAYACVAPEWQAIMASPGLERGPLALFMSQMVLWTGLKVAAALLILALLDYGYQWWQTEQDLRMTHQEVREEMRNLQGDPQIVSRRRSVQRQLASSRMALAVPQGTVTITNPTELAITLKYEAETMAAPVVVAKGAGLVAQRIRRLSLEHGIPIVERKPLAQALYKQVAVNKPIPAGLYAAVAEVLAYVHRLQGKAMPNRRGA